MNIIVYIIPFVTAIILFLFFRKRVVWWEYIVLIIPSILFTVLVKWIMVETNSSDIEYLGTYVNQITYYEPWNELVEVRHEEEYVSGHDSDGNPIYSTRVWYTTEVRNHSEYYTYKTPHAMFETEISKNLYDKIKNRFATRAQFKDMHRDYHTKDGDAYITIYDGTIEHLYDVAVTNRYRNKISANQSHTIFKMIDISKKEADSLGLYEYPDIRELNQNPIIGRTVSFEENQMIRYINATRGKRNQFRMFVLFFNESELEKSELQKSYWQNGNKNEFVLCLGMRGDSVVWTNAFSWCDIPKLEVMSRNYFIARPKLDLYEYGQWLEKEIDENWTRKEFSDFNYINIELSDGQYIALLILTIIFNILISLCVVYNNISHEDDIDTLYFIRYKK